MKLSTLQKGLVGHWPFNGNVKDRTPNGNTGTITGATLTTDKYGVANMAYIFNGTSDVISANIPDSTYSVYSISAWFKSTATGTSARPLAVFNNSTTNFRGVSFGTSGVPVVYYGANKLRLNSSGVNYHDSLWHHIVAGHDGSNAFMYIDGVAQAFGAEDTSGLTPTGTNVLKIGSNTASAPAFFQGSISGVRVFNRVITQIEASQLYNSYNSMLQLGTLEKGLVAHYPFNGNAKDATPNGNNGTVTGATLTTDRYNVANSAYAFTGTNNIGFTYNNSYKQKGTISTWVRADVAPLSFNTNSAAVCLFGSGGYYQNRISLHFWNNGVNSYAYFGEVIASTPYLATDTVNINSWAIGSWHHLIGTWDNTTGNLAFYIDGVLVKSGTFGALTAPDITASYIGVGDSTFNNTVSNVRIYNRVLSSTEITQLYNSYKPTLQTGTLSKGLVGYWKMDGNAKDTTPNGNNGAVTGATLTTDKYGVSDKAYLFNNPLDTDNNSYIDITDSTRTTWTWSAWVKPNKATNMFAGDSDGASAAIRTATSKLAYRDTAGTTFYSSDAGFSFSTKWSLVTFVSNGTTVSFYIDGVYASNCSPASTELKIKHIGRGWYDGANYYSFSGSIDDVRLYNRALSATEIAQLYNSYQ